jgi:hypothetical protein
VSAPGTWQKPLCVITTDHTVNRVLLFTASYEESWTGGRNHRAMLHAIHAAEPRKLALAVRRDLTDKRKRRVALLQD